MPSNVTLKLSSPEYNLGVRVLQCDVCGREIIGKPHQVIIERAKMTTCSKCARLGSAYWKSEPKRLKPSAKKDSVTRVRSTPARRKKTTTVREDLVVADDYALLIRQAREKSDLAQADVGKMIAEKASVISKVESGKMVPSQRLAAKLEHTLRIKLLVPLAEPETSSFPSLPSKGLTLGEIATLKEGKRRRRQTNESDHSQS
jgi:putative transcription factor